MIEINDSLSYPSTPEQRLARLFAKRQELEERNEALPTFEEFQKFPPEFQPIIDALRELTITWNPVEFVTPSKESVVREKAAFFAAFDRSEDYQPRFEYRNAHDTPFDPIHAENVLEKLLQNVRAFSPQNRQERVAKIALYYKVRDDLASMRLLLGLRRQDDLQMKEALSQKYAPTDEKLIATAQQLYEQKTRGVQKVELPEGERPLLTPEQRKLLESVELTAEETSEAFSWALAQYGLLRPPNARGFAVKISEEVNYIDVRDKSVEPMTIWVPRHRPVEKMTGLKLLRLMGHEIEGHARQSMNGQELMIGGGLLRVDEEALYEGLAKRLDAKFDREYLGEEEIMMQIYSVFAIGMAEKGASFSEIFRDQYERHMHDVLKVPHDQPLPLEDAIAPEKRREVREQAWKFAFRALRGHIDMSNSAQYAFPKDLAYLRGFLIDKQLVEDGLGYLNELAVMQTNALYLTSEMNVREEDLPFPYKDVTREYCFNILLPKLEARAKEQEQSREQ